MGSYAAIVAAVCGWALAACVVAEPSTVPATVPTTAPAAAPEQIRALISDLGSDDFATREKASLQIRRIGKAALPELERASATASEPELTHQIKLLIERLTAKVDVDSVLLKKILELGMMQASWQFKDFAMHVTCRDGKASARIVEEDREIRLEESVASVRVAVGPAGERPTAEYAATSLQELSEKHPEGFDIYLRQAARVVRACDERKTQAEWNLQRNEMRDTEKATTRNAVPTPP